MSHGDRLIHKRNLLLLRLYDNGALSSNSGIDGTQLQSIIEVGDEDFETLYKSLKQADLISYVKTWTRPSGGSSAKNFRIWLTEVGLNQVLEEKMDKTTERKTKRFRFLHRIYEETVDDNQKNCDPDEIGGELGFSRKESRQITKYLIDRGLIKNRSATTGHLVITTNGIIEVEAALDKPDESTEHFPANVIHNVINIEGPVTNSPILQGAQDSTQTVSYSPEVLQKTGEFIKLLKEVLPGLLLDAQVRAEVEAEIATIEPQLSSPKPKPNIIKSSIITIKNILENIPANVAANIIVKNLPALPLLVEQAKELLQLFQ